ncbi:MAG: PfkB family carbohydrate kinase [Pseudomonadota bacterium]
MIVTCGEALVDLMPEMTAEGVRYRPVLGGSHYTVAIGIAKLGGHAGYLWELSTDALGCALYDRLRGEGVVVDHVARSARATPIAIIDKSGPEPRYNIADPDRVMDDTPLPALPAGVSCLHIGSAVTSREPIGAAVEAFAAAAPFVSMDINARPPSIADAAAYRARLRRLWPACAIFKASVADIEAIGAGDPVAYMQSVVAAGVPLAILTMAQDGACAFTPRSSVEVPTLTREVVDPVGAGDAFMAALLATLQAGARLARGSLGVLSDQDMGALLSRAQRAAAFACARQGAEMPSEADL